MLDFWLQPILGHKYKRKKHDKESMDTMVTKICREKRNGFFGGPSRSASQRLCCCINVV